MATNQKVINSFYKGEHKAESGSLSISKNGKGDSALYSYGTPIAYKESGKSKIYVVDSKFSSTTSKQQNMVKSESGSDYVSEKLNPFKEKIEKAGFQTGRL